MPASDLREPWRSLLPEMVRSVKLDIHSIGNSPSATAPLKVGDLPALYHERHPMGRTYLKLDKRYRNDRDIR